MSVYDENNNPIHSKRECLIDTSTQTDPIKSLPCDSCVAQDVSLHPAVSSGVVSLQLATVFIPDEANNRSLTNKKKRKSTVSDNFLTSKTEVERRKREKDEVEKRIEAKRLKSESMQKEKEAKEKLMKEKKEEKEAAKRRRQEEYAKRRVIGCIEKGKCSKCGIKVKKCDISPCLICDFKFHRQCINEISFITTCAPCLAQ